MLQKLIIAKIPELGKIAMSKIPELGKIDIVDKIAEVAKMSIEAVMQNSRTWKNEYESSRKGFLELLFLVFCSLALRFLKSKALKVFKIL